MQYRTIKRPKLQKCPEMPRPKNVLWIMCDQLRYDYLGCTGHPTLKTPNIDAMAKRGVRFSNAYVQSPICGPSRMSFYTGRYMPSPQSDCTTVTGARGGSWCFTWFRACSAS
jgi:arylsulfatase A-like enzyme